MVWRLGGSSWAGALSLALVLGGCSSPPKEPPDLAADTQLACARGDASAWTFRTEAWRELARRADAGEADAFERIADHMQTSLDAGDAACAPSRIAALRETARRLRADSRRGEPGETARKYRPAVNPAETPVKSEPPASEIPKAHADRGSPAQEAEDRAKREVPRVRVEDGRFAVYRRVLRSGQARFRRCYEGALARHEEPTATAIEFGIAADGHVDQTSFEGGSAFFDGCMDAALKGLRFPEGAGRIVVRYPLTELPK